MPATIAKSKTLTPRQHRAIGFLMTEPTILEAARKTGVHERRLRAWMDQPPFAEAYRRARQEVTRQTVALLRQSAGTAVRALMEIIVDDHTSGSVKVAAIRTVLEFSFKGAEMDNGDRIRELEHALENLQAQIVAIAQPEACG